MSVRYIGALDAGTTSVRFLVFDRDARVVAQAQKEHRQIFPQQGWVEHDPLEIWTNCAEVMCTALSDAGLTGNDIEAVGITNQRETTVIWERATGRAGPQRPGLAGHAYRPVVQPVGWRTVWSRRLPTGAACRSLPTSPRPKSAGFWNTSTTAWPGPGAGTSASEPSTPGCCSSSAPTGRHVTDVTNASRTMCMNLETLDWDDSLLAALGIPAAILPTVAPSSSPDALGVTAADGPLGAQVPICGILGDQQAATVGQACLTPGEAKNTYGTGCFLHSQYGAGDPAQHQGVDLHRGLPVRQPAGRLCLGRVGGHGRGHGAVAARRNADD